MTSDRTAPPIADAAVKPDRRAFMTGSLVVGAAAMSSPAFGGQPGPSRDRARGAKGPTAAVAHAEAGPIGTEPDVVATPSRAGEAVIARPGSDYMVDLMKAAEIRYVAVMPGSSFRGLQESIVNHGGNVAPEIIVCVHEEISAAMAHGYAKVAGKPMACLLHSNVGLQHASMAIYNAWCDRAPMLLLTANHLDATKRRPGVEWTHATQDLGSFVRDYIKWDDVPVSLAHYGESFARAMQLTMTPPYEPVMIVVDSELQESAIPPGTEIPVPRLSVTAPPAGDPVAVELAADLLVAADQPMIAADRAARTPAGVRRLVRLAELLNAPVVDRGGRMNMPTTHYLNQTGRQSALVAGSDVILGLELTDIWGLVNNVSDKAERKSQRLARADAKVIGISANYAFAHGNVQDVQRYYAADVTLAADAETCLPQLIAAVERRLTGAHRRTIADRKAALEASYRDMRAGHATAAARGWDASPISTARLSMEIWDRIRTLDWGLVSNSDFISAWPQRLWDITEHHQYIGGEGGYGVGYGLPAALGAALAHRDAGRIAVSIQTDGDVMMLPGTFWTLAHHNVPILIVMHNNRAWHQETMHLKRIANRRDRGPESWDIGTTITDPNIDYAGLARSMGVWAEGPIDDPARLGAALDRALAVTRSGKPALVDVVTQPR